MNSARYSHGKADLRSSGAVLLPARGGVAYAPPLLNAPVEEALPAGFFEKDFGGQDAILKLPVKRTSSAVLKNIGNLRIIGGFIENTANASCPLTIQGVTGSVFLEGLLIKMVKSADALDISGVLGKKPDVYFQKNLVTGVNGTSGGAHADIFQPQGDIGRLFLDRLTGDTTYQGIFIPPAFAITEAWLSRVNLKYGDPASGLTTYPLWFRSTAEQAPYPVHLSQVYVKPREGQTVAQAAVWPNNEQGAIGAIEAGGIVSWPEATKISGIVIPGAPPGGDFVTEAEVGLGYVPLGYENA